MADAAKLVLTKPEVLGEPTYTVRFKVQLPRSVRNRSTQSLEQWVHVAHDMIRRASWAKWPRFGLIFFFALELSMNQLVKGMVAGFVATIVLSALMVVKGIMGVMPALDLPDMIAEMMGMSGNTLVGWLIHFFIGIVPYGVAIALLDSRLPEKSSVAHGVALGGIGWLAMMLTLMPMADAGLFGLSLGAMAPVMTLVVHLIFGAVLGWYYGRSTRDATEAMAAA